MAIVISLLPMAAVGEMVGFRRVFQVGVAVFTLGSLGCTVAHSLPTLALLALFRARHGRNHEPEWRPGPFHLFVQDAKEKAWD
jgi:hypothetical protein